MEVGSQDGVTVKTSIRVGDVSKEGGKKCRKRKRLNWGGKKKTKKK